MGYQIIIPNYNTDMDCDMNIYDLKINRSAEVFGVDPQNVMISFKARSGERFTLSLFCKAGVLETYSLGLDDITSFYLDFPLKGGVEYRISVCSDCGDTAELDFVTAEPLGDRWLVTQKNCPVFRKAFTALPAYGRAALTVAGLGLYAAFLNGRRVGSRFLTPGMNDYDDCVRYQTYDIAELLVPGENVLEVWLGNGWYKGRFGIDGHGGNTWGSEYCLNAALSFDGVQKIVTDESWQVSEGYVTDGGIYDGEWRDDTRKLEFSPARTGSCARKTVPDPGGGIRVYEERKPRLIVTPRGEQVLDFMQNSAGIVSFSSRLKRGQKLRLQFGEILQGGCFYRDNLRSARAEYEYISDGALKTVEQLFTFYGFRYAKVECDGAWAPEDFTARYLSSSMQRTASFACSHPKLARLIENVRYGQMSNFIDVPTDCPQRDERLGWTADTQVFASTANYNGEAYGFYKKFMADMMYDQNTYYGGDFPMYSPSLKGCAGHGGAIWADAGVIVPWELFRTYRDKKLLSEHYPAMKRYVDLLIAGDEERGDGHLLTQPFTFGDWLAQDGICPQSMRGGTNDVFLRSAYYFYAVTILSKAAEELEKEEARQYGALAEEIGAAIRREFFTATGRLALDTQAAYIIALRFGLYPDLEKLKEGFRDRLMRDLYRIKCGFAGAPLMVKTLFDHGMKEEALRILFNEKYPGWFYEIGLGATTVWERWNSVDGEGNITGIAMNSLNHYAYGSVAEAVYAYIGGLQPLGDGWRRAKIAPVFTGKVRQCEFTYASIYGDYTCRYRIEEGMCRIEAVVPHGCSALVELPLSGKEPFLVGEGRHVFEYCPTEDVLHPYSTASRLCDILADERAAELLRECLPATYALVTSENEEFTVQCLDDMVRLPMYGVTKEGYERFKEGIGKVEV